MSLPKEIQRNFHLYVTYVDGEGPFLRISGQLDKQAACMVESLIDTARPNFDQGIGCVTSASILEGIICAAKYKDGAYYRAKIINTTNLSNGLVGVHFIDYGNKDTISLSTIRFLDKYDPLLLQLPGQATDYYLARIMSVSGRWEEPLLLKLQSLICYSEYPATVEAQTRSLPIISLQYQGNDLGQYLITCKFGIMVPVPKQEVLLLQLSNDSVQPLLSNWSSFPTESNSYSEHVPFFANQNFPSNPASAMRIQQNVSASYNGGYAAPPPSSSVSQRLLVNKVSRAPVTLRAPFRQPQQQGSAQVAYSPYVPPPAKAAAAAAAAAGTGSAPTPITKISSPAAAAPVSPKRGIKTYKSRLLEVKSQHKVFVSYAEEGPSLFAVQLVTDAKKLQDMMDEINRQPHRSLTEPPMIGTVCLGRMSGDRIICRAIVMNLSGTQCKLFFVDFGDTEMVSYYDIFDIPEEFVKPNVFAMRFSLSGVKNLKKSPHLDEAFKQLVNGKVLTLRVVPPEGPPLIQYGELYIDNQNVLELLTTTMKQTLQFKNMDLLPRGTRCLVLVSYVNSCNRFYIQLSSKIDELNAVMDAVKLHCERTQTPGQLPVGAACCAKFPEDGNWYRARVRSTNGGKVVVAYVDYGNECEVELSDLRTITPDLIQLPSQALMCSLKGFEDKPVETKTSNLLEMLVLEKTLLGHVVGLLSGDSMLLSLVDESVTPPMDVYRKMMELSQPRGHEQKVSTPIRKDAPDVFSSPESVTSDERKKGYKREKSFKDDRRPPRENDDFAARPGSFRAREERGFDRSAPARHSDKFGGRPDRGDRRGNTGGARSATEDSWEDTPAQNNFTQNRQPMRDKRKPNAGDKGPKGAWKKNDSVGKRLKQAVEASESFSQKGHGQDRSKRENKFNKQDDWEESKNNWDSNRKPDRKDDWGEKKNKWGDKKDNWGEKKDNWSEKKDNWGDKKDNWSEKKDNWGEKKDNWGEKKDNWGEKKDSYGERKNNWGEKENFQKRDFKERGDRPPRSNFTPRDRADKSFGSGSEKSYKSDAARTGRGPPFKSRSNFTQVQYKELPSPVPLTTPFSEQTIEPNAQHEVSVTWIISPDSFYTQILSLQQKFLDMMQSIPDIYKGVKPYVGDIPVGASVLAKYPEDGVLYRANVISVQPFGKFIVQYIDFGNKFLVDARDIWQLDQGLMELPKMAVHCSLLGVAPKDTEWKSNNEIDLCFNAPRYQCIFTECTEGKYKVSLWNNGASVADMLIEKDLATAADQGSSVTVKDEAIDLTIIVGQEINCRVTHVEAFTKFYVQLDLEKAALVEEAIANYDVSLLTPLAAENLAEGVHCTLKHEGKIYRAILNSVADITAIDAVLPDYGRQIKTSLDNLMILPTDLSVYYYQSLECSLNNYKDESNKLLTLEQLKERLTDKKFIIYINDVEDYVLITTLYDSITGQKVAIFEPDEGAYEKVNQLCARSVYNYNFGLATVAHAETLNEIYLMKASDDVKIGLLLEELFKFYEEGMPEEQPSFEESEKCAAKSSDGNWYRATITSASDTECTIQFVDYGNSETVPKESIKKLDIKFYEPCALALVVSLGLVPTNDDALIKFKEWTEEKELQVTLSFGSDGWLANLHLDGVDLAMKLVNENLAAPPKAKEEPEVIATEVEPISLPPGCTQAYISHIDSPGQFWLQTVENVDKIEEIQSELQEKAAEYPNVENREVGTLCVAKYSADDQWYRAVILDSDSDITTVRFIDYGNADVLDNKPDLLKIMPEHLKNIESYAIKSSVNATPTGTGQWSEPASDYFTELCGDLSAPFDAAIILKDVTTYVDLYINGQNLTEKLVSEGHATRSEEAECGGNLPTCFASHINSPSEFWIQLETATPELQAVENAMVDAENFPELTNKEEGVICAAKYPEDGAWYRAQVIVDGSEGTEVLFMDYGNASITSELRTLPEELKVKPALSRKCALQKSRDIKTWSRKSEAKFNELAAEGATIFNVQFIASGDISIVELFLDGKSVTEELVALCEEQTEQNLAERPIPVGQDLQSNCKICYSNSVDEFYVRLDTAATDLEMVVEKLIDAPEFKNALELKVGSICAAFWEEDEQWYRAKILEFCDVGAHVQFIDYGNKAKCEEFRQLPQELSNLESLTKCCRLSGSESISDHAKKRFEEIANDNSVFLIEFLDTSKEPALVKLILNDTDVISIINRTVTEDKTPKVETENVAELDETEDGETPNELNESIDSSNTVIENKSFEGDCAELVEGEEETTLKSPEVESNNSTLKSSDDTIQTTEGDESRESFHTDTEYTSDNEKSPMKDSLTTQTISQTETSEDTQLSNKESNNTPDGSPTKKNVDKESPKNSPSKPVEDKSSEESLTKNTIVEKEESPKVSPTKNTDTDKESLNEVVPDDLIQHIEKEA